MFWCRRLELSFHGVGRCRKFPKALFWFWWSAHSFDPTYSKGFKSRYPNHAQICDRSAVVQRRILSEMLTALSQAETDVSHILEIVSGDKRGGEQFHGSTPSVSSFPSLAEQTISSYDTGGARTTSASNSELKCFDCGGPHPWSENKGRNWVIVCPQANQPGVRDHAKMRLPSIVGIRRRRLSKVASARISTLSLSLKNSFIFPK